MKHTLTALFTLLASAAVLPAASYYTLRLDDSKAVYLTRGAGDDSDAIQQAIDKVQATTGEGIVFVPEGRYRLTKTVYIWPAIRLIGYGAERPGLRAGREHSRLPGPGATRSTWSSCRRRRSAGRRGATDAGAGTFYSGHEQHRYRDSGRQSGRGRGARTSTRSTASWPTWIFVSAPASRAFTKPAT